MSAEAVFVSAKSLKAMKGIFTLLFCSVGIRVRGGTLKLDRLLISVHKNFHHALRCKAALEDAVPGCLSS